MPPFDGQPGTLIVRIERTSPSPLHWIAKHHAVILAITMLYCGASTHRGAGSGKMLLLTPPFACAVVSTIIGIRSTVLVVLIILVVDVITYMLNRLYPIVTLEKNSD